MSSKQEAESKVPEEKTGEFKRREKRNSIVKLYDITVGRYL